MKCREELGSNYQNQNIRFPKNLGDHALGRPKDEASRELARVTLGSLWHTIRFQGGDILWTNFSDRYSRQQSTYLSSLTVIPDTWQTV